MRKTVRYILKTITMAYIIMILILVIPSFFGIEILAVTSGSMEPAISVGSVVYAQPVSFTDIQEGDIITFHLEKSSTKVTHRVVKKEEALQCVSTKGDANEEPDARPVEYQNIEGVVRCTIPYLGRIAILLNEVYGKVILVSIFLMFLALEELVGKEEPGRDRIEKRGGAYGEI